jgi:hypothetical protein
MKVLKLSFKSFTILSNLAFVAPLLIAVNKSAYLYALTIICVFITSCLFHLNKQKRYMLIDSFFAWLLIATNLMSFYLKGFGSIHFYAAVIFVIIGLYFRSKADKKSYRFNHSVWHIASAIITILAIL